jgi:hypothetical protein
MLDVRKGMTVHKDGTVTRKHETLSKPESRGDETRGHDDASESQASPVASTESTGSMSSRHSPQGDGGPSTSRQPAAITSLTFAGATFTRAECYDAGELLFTSGDEHAISSIKALEAMGLAGKWQRAGDVEVSISNSGPKGAETSIRVRTGGMEIGHAVKAMEGLGIGVA